MGDERIGPFDGTFGLAATFHMQPQKRELQKEVEPASVVRLLRATALGAKLTLVLSKRISAKDSNLSFAAEPTKSALGL